MVATLNLYRTGQPIFQWILKISINFETVRNKQNHLKYKNVITLKLTDIELNIVNHAATMAGLSRSEYIRQLILNGTVPVRYEIVADMDDLKKLVGEYGKIGSNLNQIAKYFNTGGMRSLAIEDEIHQCIADLFKLRKKVLEMAGDTDGSS